MRISLSSSALKLIAIGTMVVDHIGFLFFPHQALWRIIGRLSFPLFAFLIAEGFEKTSNFTKYAERLIIFAALAQAPYALFLSAAHSPQTLNIFFTLAAGLFAIAALSRFPHRFSIPLVIGIAYIAEILQFDYGAYGILTILASHLLIRRRMAGLSALIFLPILYSFLIALKNSVPIQICAALSVPFIALYRGARGAPLPRALIYAFYPAHLLLLSLIWYCLSL